MDIELKNKWLTALRSGDYNQASDALRAFDKVTNTDCYCCLGVLCDIMPNVEWSPQSEGSTFYQAVFEDGRTNSAYLPMDVSKQLGLSKKIEHPEYNYEVSLDTILMTLNDRGDNFAEIADYIEANL